MDTISYVVLTRQTGLRNELQVVANNIANMSTTGYRAEGVVFAEMVEALPAEGGSVAMTEARVRYTNALPGALTRTGGTFDMGIQGDGFFQIETPDGPRLSRNGAFATNAESELVTLDGYPVLDASGARVSDEDADVTLSADADTFQAIISGELNPTSAFMTGKLSVDGDMGMAMKLASVLA